MTFKQRNRPEAVEEKITVTDWRQNELIVRNQTTFQEYEIYVQAENNEGAAPDSQLRRRIGFSGQDSMSIVLSHLCYLVAIPVFKSLHQIKG